MSNAKRRYRRRRRQQREPVAVWHIPGPPVDAETLDELFDKLTDEQREHLHVEILKWTEVEPVLVAALGNCRADVHLGLSWWIHRSGPKRPG